MNFNWENKEKIDEIYIHDSIFEGYFYDYINRKMILRCAYRVPSIKIQFTFNNIIMHKMQSCCLWGPGVHILVVYYDQECELINEAIRLLKDERDKHGRTYLDEDINYIPVVFELNSGDVLSVICESFEYEELWE